MDNKNLPNSQGSCASQEHIEHSRLNAIIHKETRNAGEGYKNSWIPDFLIDNPCIQDPVD